MADGQTDKHIRGSVFPLHNLTGLPRRNKVTYMQELTSSSLKKIVTVFSFTADDTTTNKLN